MFWKWTWVGPVCWVHRGCDNFKRLLVVHGSWLMVHMEMGAQGVIFLARLMVVHGSWLMAHMEMEGSCVLGAHCSPLHPTPLHKSSFFFL